MTNRSQKWICAVCRKGKRLTREHVIPDGLLTRIEKLPSGIRPNLIWREGDSDAIGDLNHTIRDTCSDCQKLFGRVYDQMVDEAFDAFMTMQEKATPLSICVREPWFTLYLLRLLWNISRSVGKNIVPKELQQLIFEYARCPSGQHYVPIRYCLALSHFPIRTIEKTSGRYAAVFRAYCEYKEVTIGQQRINAFQTCMNIIGLRFLMLEAYPVLCSNAAIQEYYKQAVTSKNGVFLQPNSQSSMSYSFLNSDPDLYDYTRDRTIHRLLYK